MEEKQFQFKIDPNQVTPEILDKMNNILLKDIIQDSINNPEALTVEFSKTKEHFKGKIDWKEINPDLVLRGSQIENIKQEISNFNQVE